MRRDRTNDRPFQLFVFNETLVLYSLDGRNFHRTLLLLLDYGGI